MESQRSQMCQACDEQNPAVSRCMDCEHFLCQECQSAHERLKQIKSHRIYTLPQLHMRELSNSKNHLWQGIPKCGQHPTMNLSLYCPKCEQLVCAKCRLEDHGKHGPIGLGRAITECRQGVEEMTAQIQENMQGLSTVIEEVGQVQHKLDKLFQDTTTKLSNKADHMVEEIREAERSLKQGVESIYKEKVKPFESARAINSKELSLAQKKLQEVNRQMSEATDYEILSLRQTLLQSLRELISTWKKPEIIPDMQLAVSNFSERLGLLASQGMHPGPGRQFPNDKPPCQSHQSTRSPTAETSQRCEQFPPGQDLLGPTRTTSPEEPPRSQSSETSVSPTQYQLRRQAPQIPARVTPAQKLMRPIGQSPGFEPPVQRFGTLTLIENDTKGHEELPQKEVWRFVTKIKKFGSSETKFRSAFGIAMFSTGDIVTSDVGRRQLVKITNACSTKSRYSKSLIGKNVTLPPTHVAVNKNDQLVVLISPIVLMFTKEGQFIRQFLPGRTESKKAPTCLAVDDNNLIAVGFVDNDEIALHNVDGTLIKMLSAPLIGQYLIASKQKFVYTNSTRKQLVSVDYNGNVVFSLDMQLPKKGKYMYACPTGICSGADGSLYVAIKGSGSGKIYEYTHPTTLDEPILRCVIADYTSPVYCITCNLEGNELAVATGRAIHIYRREPTTIKKRR